MLTGQTLAKEFVPCLFCGQRESIALYSPLPNVVQCSCGLVYTNWRLKEESLKALYCKEYFESHASEALGYDNYVSDKRLVEKTFARRLRGLENRWLESKGRVLDVGCATGFFLSIAKSMGWDVNGVEISDYCCDYAEREFGIRLFRGQFKDLAAAASTYNLITMWDYVEHSFTPDKDIEKAFELLKPGGLLALATPDIGSWPARFFKSNWIGFKEHEHLFYFSAKNLSKLLGQKGFRVVSTSYAGKYVSVKFFLKRLSVYFKGLAGLLGWLGDRQPLADADFYCNPFDIVYLVAQKPPAKA